MHLLHLLHLLLLYYLAAAVSKVKSSHSLSPIFPIGDLGSQVPDPRSHDLSCSRVVNSPTDWLDIFLLQPHIYTNPARHVAVVSTSWTVQRRVTGPEVWLLLRKPFLQAHTIWMRVAECLSLAHIDIVCFCNDMPFWRLSFLRFLGKLNMPHQLYITITLYRDLTVSARTDPINTVVSLYKVMVIYNWLGMLSLPRNLRKDCFHRSISV